MSKAATLTEELHTATARLYLASALVTEEGQLQQLVDFLKKAGAEIKKSESLGARALFVRINKHSSLTLVSVFFELPSTELPKVEKALRHESYIERFLLTTWDGPIDQPARRSNRAKAETKEKEENVQS